MRYQPKADLMMVHQDSFRRVWIELEIIPADPVANPAKFNSAHLIKPSPPRILSYRWFRGTLPSAGNITARAVWLLRTSGLRVFQMRSLPQVHGKAIKL